MKNTITTLFVAAAALLLNACSSGPSGRQALVSNVDARALEVQSRSALTRLYQTNPGAKHLASQAEGILVFPSIKKGGLVVAGAWGDGTLYQKGKEAGYFRSLAASYGLQAGLQEFGYALFLMDDKAVRNLNRSGGWEVGSSPSLTVIDKGVAGSLSTTTVDRGTHAVFFDQKGLMAGLGLQGTKITRLAIKP